MPIIANAQAEARGILVSPESNVQGEIAISDAIAQRIRFQEEKRHNNIRAVVQQAALQLENQEVPDAEPNHDWTARFFNGVQDVSSEDMQLLWAKVLAGEIKCPGSVSLLTLDVLKNLDRPTATLFETLSSVCVSITTSPNSIIDARVPSLGGNADDNALQKYGLGFLELTILNEHRLIISNFHSWRDYILCFGIKGDYQASPVFIPITIQGRHWLLSPTHQYTRGKDFKVYGVALTRSGQELLEVVTSKVNERYLHDLMSFFMRYGIQMVEVSSSNPQSLDNSPAP